MDPLGLSFSLTPILTLLLELPLLSCELLLCRDPILAWPFLELVLCLLLSLYMVVNKWACHEYAYIVYIKSTNEQHEGQILHQEGQ